MTQHKSGKIPKNKACSFLLGRSINNWSLHPSSDFYHDLNGPKLQPRIMVMFLHGILWIEKLTLYPAYKSISCDSCRVWRYFLLPYRSYGF
jgi:hypothetical protein